MIRVAGQDPVGVGRNSSVGGLSVYGGATTPSDSNAELVVVPSSVNLASTTALAWTSGAVTLARDTVMTRRAPATFNLGAADSATPIAQTLATQGSRGGIDTNVAGAEQRFQSGNGTGNATGSSLILATPTATASGTTQQTSTARLTLTEASSTFSNVVVYPAGSAAAPSITQSGSTSSGLHWSSGILSYSYFGGDVVTLGNGAVYPSNDAGADLGTASKHWSKLYVDYTNTATVGAVTINKAAGRVRIAAAGSSVVVTNSIVTAASHVFVETSTNDATCSDKNVVPAAGSFTITTTATCTAETTFDFFVVNAD